MSGSSPISECELVLHLGSDIREVDATKKLCWDERIARLFACDCAAHVLSIFEGWRPNNKYPRNAVEVARRYAKGQASTDEMQRAWSDARDTASSTKYKDSAYTDFIAYCAARAASDCAAADVEWGERSATFAAAARSGATRDKKGTTVNQSLAWISERAYQTGRLMKYLDGVA